MPGPSRWRSPTLINHNLSSQKLRLPDIDERITALLTFVQKMARRNPDVVFGDGVERSNDSPERRLFCRQLASECIVLLKNKGGLLPLKEDKVKKIAVIGPNAKTGIISGGGSAALKPTYVVTPWDGIVENAPAGIDVNFTVGCYGRNLSTLAPNHSSYIRY